MGTANTKFERVPLKAAPCPTSKQQISYNSFDPRSPSAAIKRTPVQKRRLHKSTSSSASVHNSALSDLNTINPSIIIDPRSPYQTRTPITKALFSHDKDTTPNNNNNNNNTNFSPNTSLDLDPRSPSSQILRTPIPITYNAHNDTTPNSNNNNTQDSNYSPISYNKESVFNLLNGADDERKVIIDNPQNDIHKSYHSFSVQSIDSQPIQMTSPKVIQRRANKQLKGSPVSSPIKKRKGSNISNTLPSDIPSKKSMNSHENIENTPPNPRLQTKISTPNTPRTPLSQK